MMTPKKVKNAGRRLKKLTLDQMEMLGRFEKEMAREAALPLEELQAELNKLETPEDIELFYQEL
jgi:hypothetical protein